MKAIAYLRVSTKDQSDRGYSLPTQLMDIKAYAARVSLEIVEIIQEDESGFLLERPGLTRARTMLASGQAGALIAHDSDRLSREPAHSIQLRDEFEAGGIELHYALRGQISLGDFGADIYEDIRARSHKEEIKKFVERSKRGKRGKVRSGKTITANRTPYGYRKQGDGLAIDEDEAKIVRLIFKLYTVDQLSIRDIAEHLTQMKAPTAADKNPNIAKKRPFGHWEKNSVREILHRETYTGVWHWGKTRRTIIKGRNGSYVSHVPTPRENWLAVPVPAIIDRETYRLAMANLESNKYTPKNLRFDYLMTGRLTCGRCDRSVYGSCKTRGDWKRQYYICSSKTYRGKGPNCGAPYFRARLVDDCVWLWIKEHLAKPEMMQQLIEANLGQRRDEQTELKAELERVDSRIKDKRGGLSRLAAFIAGGELSTDGKAAFEEQLAGLQAEIETLRAERDRITEQIDSIPTRDELVQLYAGLYAYQEMLIADNEPPEVKQAWVQALGVRVSLIDDGRRPARLRISCYIGVDDLPISTNTHMSYGRKWQIFDVIELPLNVSS